MAVASQRLYLTTDDRVVTEGDPDAAFLLCAEGSEIPDGYSEPSAPKQAEPPANKAEPAPANKSRTTSRKPSKKDD